MAWQGILGHDKIAEQFRRALQRGRLNGSFLFVGPAGIGKRRFAFALAKTLLCKERNDLTACGTCESCKLFHDSPDVTDWDFSHEPFVSPHLDLFYIAKPSGKSDLPVDLIIGNKDNRGASGLIYHISRTAFVGTRKVAIIDDTDFFNAEGGNALLKTLEEPPMDSVIILLGTSTAKQLPTIRSRCQIIRFASLPDNVLAELLLQRHIVLSQDEARKLAQRSDGSIERAVELLDSDIDRLREQVKKSLSALRFDAVQFAAEMNIYIDAKGKEAENRRPRLRLVLQIAADFFAQRLQTAEFANTAIRHLERTLDAIEHLESNANLPVIVEAWSLELAGN